MKTDYLAGQVERELRSLKDELLAYEDEKQIWELPEGISNSTGTLTMHLVGNLRHFISTTLGKSDYVRNRKAEFESRNIARNEILISIDAATSEVPEAIRNLTPDQLDSQYPIEFGGVSINTGDFVLHLLGHLTYHLGQIDYHRRLVTGSNTTVKTLAISRLTSAAK
ncbi:MAG: DinB family protein [Calditrichia bacterium]